MIGFGIFAFFILFFSDGLQSVMFKIYNNADQSTGRLQRFQNPQQLNYLYQLRYEMFYRDIWIAICLIASTLSIIWLAITKKIPIQLFSFFLILILCVDLGYVGRKVISPMFSSVSKKELEPRKTQLIEYLDQDNDIFRVYPIDNPTTNDYGWFGIATIGGYHAAKMANYEDFISQKFLDKLQFLQMTNTKYIISRKRVNHPELIFEKTFNGENIYKLKNWLPRVFLIDSVITSPDKSRTFEIIKSNMFNPSQHIILNKTLKSLEFNVESSEVIIDSWEPEKITISISVENDGILAFSEGYYPPGWHAFIDGQETEIYQANHFMQAIVVPAGQHKVEFVFSLPSFELAFLLSKFIFIGILAILTGFGLWAFRNKFKSIL